MSIFRVVPVTLFSAFLFGCSGGDDTSNFTPAIVDPEAARAAVTRGEGLDPATYAGDVAFKISKEVQTEEASVPLVLYAGLSPVTDARLGANFFIDLRLAQARLPELLSGVIVDNCGLEVSLDFDGVEQESENLRAGGIVTARVFGCRSEGTQDEERGRRIFTQKLAAIAEATAIVRNNCVEFHLIDLQLDPHGLIGGLATLFGFTERARKAILDESATFLSQNPICPTLPPELSSLAPSFTSGGLREIGDGGVGATFSGSVDTTAATLIQLLAVLKESDLIEEQR
ncbi:hypothetical protein [Aliiruegeria lutimaris]|uniref:Lipoprotein n=1 Tax=Aliiruegeria lutimaris TaxID=571298 RepID=A0A1G9QDW6_9RHOB|nr:hypothetical protein [Aliiruegeria lutimaris]SDM08525.1 hypothetical protein SAMN04488026_11672 [Aliiruegeria lutimaris]